MCNKGDLVVRGRVPGIIIIFSIADIPGKLLGCCWEFLPAGLECSVTHRKPVPYKFSGRAGSAIVG